MRFAHSNLHSLVLSYLIVEYVSLSLQQAREAAKEFENGDAYMATMRLIIKMFAMIV